MDRAGTARAERASSNFFTAFSNVPGAAPCNLDGISMNIQEENSSRYLQTERERTLVPVNFSGTPYLPNIGGQY